MKKRTILSSLTLAILTGFLVGCNEADETPVIEENNDVITSIKLDKKAASLFYSDKATSSFNEELQLSPVVYPKKSGKRNVKWSSSDTNVATVDQNGLVKAVGEGFAEITVSNDDGSASASTHICVNNMNGCAISYCNSRLNDIITVQNRSAFNVPDVVTAFESFTQTVSKNDKVISKTYFTQSIKTSKENAFIQLDIDEIDWKCENASPELSSFQYVFYTTDQYESYLFKTSGLTNNYMSVNQSDFIGKGKLEALKAICNNFFTSGDSIITDNYSDILMQDTKNGWISSNEQNEHYGRMSNVQGQLAFDIKQSINYTATCDDEDDMQIPVGTNYVLDVYDRILYENYLVKSKYIEQTASWSIDGDNYSNSVVVDYYYSTNDEIVYPNKDNYSKVDSIFNL